MRPYADEAIILLVEDSDDDVLLIKKSFESAAIPNLIYVVRDGEEAILYLCARESSQTALSIPCPT